ncbi:MAG: AraC family transcriptional regulator [Opitutaceae bacterium]
MKNDLPQSEKNICGRGSRERIVVGGADDTRDWLAHAPICEALGRRTIAHVGVAEVCHPYEVVRRDLSGTFVMACCAGEGNVWLDGRWQTFRAGFACIAPPHVVHAYRAVPGRRWEFVWVRYREPPQRRPIVSASSPMLAAFDGEALRAAVLGLYHEASGSGAPALMDAWAELIEQYVCLFTHPWREDDRLQKLWDEVAADLSHDWSVEELARRAGLSSQQLRRICVHQLGRKPAEQLAWLRIRTSAALLSREHAKIESIALAVGYRSAYRFSTTFRRLTGCRPSEYRAR